jgi:hypothetical protein
MVTDSENGSAQTLSGAVRPAGTWDSKQSLEEFAYRQNVVNYARRLRVAPDPASRHLLITLLKEEAARARAAGWMPMLG